MGYLFVRSSRVQCVYYSAVSLWSFEHDSEWMCMIYVAGCCARSVQMCCTKLMPGVLLACSCLSAIQEGWLMLGDALNLEHLTEF